ncbi:hypothetical protein EJ05DRAFT_502923 [Pseudovirgaria hyperparasitica]|uniref:Uncharacterized protein n=1 Tax=Pseudovirgaria hyperparasitica TaxID=470096 RepID=A0A6A6W0E8_9PEZI|nr:uncharacterized protein EJ05DRAFT_502923 [Pseudovirgaria hyperparasitica]KAF2755464.1 hypothetical protein EJ05DRAFT_502923 [Pseudovirgaria hyperparasitica]
MNPSAVFKIVLALVTLVACTKVSADRDDFEFVLDFTKMSGTIELFLGSVTESHAPDHLHESNWTSDSSTIISTSFSGSLDYGTIASQETHSRIMLRRHIGILFELVWVGMVLNDMELALLVLWTQYIHHQTVQERAPQEQRV